MLHDSLAKNVATLRPVTPLGIVARNLERLCSMASTRSYDDDEFASLLKATAAVASGLDPYLERMTTPQSPALQALAHDTVRRNWDELYVNEQTALALESEMLSGHLEGQFLKILVAAMKAKRILEIGLFTGYSALAMAEALPSDGVLVACEIDAYAAHVARHWFDASGHGGKIRIEVGPALDTLGGMRTTGDTFDFVFIDADKAGYRAYLDLLIGSDLLAPGGLICVDNTLMQGQPYLDEPRTPNGIAIADFNRYVASDPRIEHVLLPVRDGITLIRRC